MGVIGHYENCGVCHGQWSGECSTPNCPHKEKLTQLAARTGMSKRDVVEALKLMVPKKTPSITCPICGRTSYNLNDVRHRYCGACDVFNPPRS